MYSERPLIYVGPLANESTLPFDAPMVGESSRAFAAFLEYAALPPGRRSVLAAYHEQRRKSGKTTGGNKMSPVVPRHWEAWCSQFNWLTRARDRDAVLAVAARRAAEASHVAELEAYHARSLATSEALSGLLSQSYEVAGVIAARLKRDGPNVSVADFSLFARSLRGLALAAVSARDIEAASCAVAELLGRLDELDGS